MYARAISRLLEKASGAPRALSAAELAELISLSDEGAVRDFHAAAHALKRRVFGDAVSVRGLVEAGNICAKDCLYCGIRKSNASLERYRLSADEIVAAAKEAAGMGYASLVLQAGEIESEENTRFFEECVRRVCALSDPPPGITLSLGEQSEETYRRWREAGALRYLLRIETSDPALYASLHPASHSWKRRAECLSALRRCGYQTGTGVMCGLPGQTPESLARDILFFGEADIDMIGMGPFIPHPGTPLWPGRAMAPEEKRARLRLGLNMIAAARLHLHDVNIAAATALQALEDDGREQGVTAGANVVMPNVTGVRWRRLYTLYEGKPCLDENASACRRCLDARLARIGERIAYGVRGDSPHFFARTGDGKAGGA